MSAETGRDAGEPRLLHSLFQQSARRWPDALAVATARTCLTYAELDDISGRVAGRIGRSGARPDDIVAVAMTKGWEQVAAVLGALRAGAAYLPVAPDLPPARFDELLRRSGCRIVLTQPGVLAGRAVPEGLEVVEVSADLAAGGVDPDSPAGVRPEHLAYVLFTSGSTGAPKGAMIEHAGVVNTVRDLNDRFELGPGDRFLGLSSLSFDMSVYDLFGAFGAGGAVVLPDPQDVRNPAAWVELMERFDVTVWNSVPMLLAMLVSWLEETGHRSAGALRLAFLGGDWIPLDLPDRARRFFHRLQVVNIGGATEASICSCFFVVDRVDPAWSAVPYGRALSGQYWRILRQDLTGCEIGEVGELYIGGVGVGRGYLNDPERTAASFPTHPRTGERLYRTGDLGRWMADGNIEFLGRTDLQVKVRGHRIELGEIETHAQAHAEVRQAVAVAVGEGRHLDRIVLYVVGAGSAPDEARLREFLRERLPGYMVPDRCHPVAVLPLSPNGKVDRAALAEQAKSLGATERVWQPRGETERQLAAVWHDLLGTRPAGGDVDFFEAGGHSLLATSLAGRIRRTFGVQVSPAFVFGHPSIEAMAAALDRMDRQDRRALPAAGSGAALTFGQEQLWFFNQLAGAGRAYQFQASIRFRGDLRVDLLQRALSAVVARHEILRTTYPDSGAAPQPIVHPPYEVELVVEDLRAVPAARRQEALREAMDREIGRTFDLSRLPLIRWRLYRTGDQEWALTEVEHHIVHDGWSVALLWREVAAAYAAWLRGEEPVLPRLEHQLSDVAALQRQDYQRRRPELLSYWTRQLAGVSPVDLPVAGRRPPRQTFAGAARRLALDPGLYLDLRRFGRERGCSLYAVMLAGYKILLHRYTGEADLCVGSWVANRLHPESERLIGMLVNMVVLRDHLDDEATIGSFLARVTDTAVAAFDRQDAPFSDVVRTLNPKRDPSRNPLVQACFSFHDSPVPEFRWPGVAGELIEEHNGSAKFDLNLVVVPHAEQRGVDEPRPGVDELVVVWEYNTDLFQPADMDRMIGHYQQVLRAMVADPDANAWRIDLRTDDERRQAGRWQGSQVGYPAATVAEVVLAQAAATPDAVALTWGDERVSYGELAERVAGYAAGLGAAGIGGGDLVAVCLDRSPDLVACLLGVMAAGAAYLPLDPAHPAARHRLIIEDAGVAAVIHEGSPERFRPVADVVLDPARLAAGRASGGASGGGPGGGPGPASPEDRAYVMFTSGSTGRPKGVEVAHRSVVNLLWDMRQRLRLCSDDVVAAVTTVAFDISVLELFGVLAAGGTADLIPEAMIARPAALINRIRDTGVTVLQATPTMWRLLLESGMPEPAGRFVGLCGGETCPPELAARIARRTSEAWNVYGPTETTIWSTAHRLTLADGAAETVPIGVPLANTRCWVLSRHGVPQPAGLPGELHIGGDGVAMGYLDRPELTSRRFIPPPEPAAPGERCFATGDLSRWHPERGLEFLGREDTQVKLRGFRIELAEVEAVLCAHPQVRNAAVVLEAVDDPGSEPYLAAYLETSETGADAIRGYLREHLPAYMEPRRMVRVDVLPTTTTGKVDRARLGTLAATDLAAGKAVPDGRREALTGGDTERVLAEIFAEVLGVSEVDPHEDFFELGGHSLLALRLAHRVRETLAIDIGLELILDHGSVSELAEVLGG
jgi:amino acid adenylation domain-containing protein